MKLLVDDSSGLARCVDARIEADASIVLRYRGGLEFFSRPEDDLTFKDHLSDASLGEGARIFPLLEYRGVEVHILDETSRMATGSLKAVDGCLTTSFCRVQGLTRIAFESGGNTGSALTRYGQAAGLETFFFCPVGNLDLLDGRLFLPSSAHLIGVEGRERVKEVTAAFARATGIRRVPERPWRHAASLLRGLFVVEHVLAGREYDWIVQAVSAAFGPIGIYGVLEAFRAELKAVPRFLGIQQEANCPLVRAWRVARGQEAPGEDRPNELLTRVMYDDAPQTYRTLEDLEALLARTGGDLLTVNGEEFGRALGPSGCCASVLSLLQGHGVSIAVRAGRVLENTGLMALVGTLKAIDEGTIRQGSRVLCCLTSGVSSADGSARPEVTVREERDVLAYAEKVLGGAP